MIRFKFKNLLYSLDASTIDLCLSVFPWAEFRSTKGAIKLHVGLNHDGYLPEFVTMSDGRCATSLQLEELIFLRAVSLRWIGLISTIVGLSN